MLYRFANLLSGVWGDLNLDAKAKKNHRDIYALVAVRRVLGLVGLRGARRTVFRWAPSLAFPTNSSDQAVRLTPRGMHWRSSGGFRAGLAFRPVRSDLECGAVL
jgi:hypothetical protein